MVQDAWRVWEWGAVGCSEAEGEVIGVREERQASWQLRGEAWVAGDQKSTGRMHGWHALSCAPRARNGESSGELARASAEVPLPTGGDDIWRW